MIFSPYTVLINAGFFDVGVGPGVQNQTIEAYTLASNGKLANMWPD